MGGWKDRVEKRESAKAAKRQEANQREEQRQYEIYEQRMNTNGVSNAMSVVPTVRDHFRAITNTKGEALNRPLYGTSR
jgi:hypothetical protein